MRIKYKSKLFFFIRLTLIVSGAFNPLYAENSSDIHGWAYMMCAPTKDFALLYFENQSVLPTLSGFKENTAYKFQWFNPRNGEWEKSTTIESDEKGVLALPAFPDGENPSTTDWAAKILDR